MPSIVFLTSGLGAALWGSARGGAAAACAGWGGAPGFGAGSPPGFANIGAIMPSMVFGRWAGSGADACAWPRAWAAMAEGDMPSMVFFAAGPAAAGLGWAPRTAPQEPQNRSSGARAAPQAGQLA